MCGNVMIQQYKEPEPIDAHLSTIHVGDDLRNVLLKINPKGTSCKFAVLARRNDGEYLVLESRVIKSGDQSKSNPAICTIDFVFRHSSLIGISTYEQMKAVWKGDTPSEMIDAFIRSAQVNGMNDGSYSYDPDIQPTPDPGLTAVGIILYPIGVVNAPVRFLSLTKLLAVHQASDIQSIDPKAVLDITVPHDEGLHVSEIFPKSDSHVYFLTSHKSADVITIFGPDWWRIPK